jgi:hypothetical protein
MRERETQSYKNFGAERQYNKTINLNLLLFFRLFSFNCFYKKKSSAKTQGSVERRNSDGIEAAQ